MKKLLSLLLAVLMCFSVCTIAFAGSYKQEGNNYPVIMISGYSSSSLRYFDEETGEEIHAWGNTGDQIMMALEEYKEELIVAARIPAITKPARMGGRELVARVMKMFSAADLVRWAVG